MKVVKETFYEEEIFHPTIGTLCSAKRPPQIWAMTPLG